MYMYKCCMHKNYGKFSARKHNIDAFSGSNDARFELMMSPAFEKSLSEGVLVAGLATRPSIYTVRIDGTLTIVNHKAFVHLCTHGRHVTRRDIRTLKRYILRTYLYEKETHGATIEGQLSCHMLKVIIAHARLIDWEFPPRFSHRSLI